MGQAPQRERESKSMDQWLSSEPEHKAMKCQWRPYFASILIMN